MTRGQIITWQPSVLTSAVVAIAFMAIGARGANVLPIAGLAHGMTAFAPSAITPIDNRLYRHCHIKGSRLFVVCMTADPWSPETAELRRRQAARDAERSIQRIDQTEVVR